MKFGMRHGAWWRFVVFEFQSDWWRGAPSARANVGARPPRRVSMRAGISAARRNSTKFAPTRLPCRVHISATGRRSRHGTNSDGIWIEEIWAIRMVCSSRLGTCHVQSGSSNFEEIDEICEIASAFVAIRHMTLNWVSECVIGLVLLY